MDSTTNIYWITGLPAAGKTTLAQALADALTESGRLVFMLDGDELRKGLCVDLGLSDTDRSENIRRAGEVARLMVKAGITVVCAFVSPFEADRQRVRSLFPAGQFTEIHVNTPLEECVRRDPKGLYAKARAGAITGLTGWDAPYEAPRQPEFIFNTLDTGTPEMVRRLLSPDDPTP